MVESEAQLCAETSTASAVPIQRHVSRTLRDNFQED